MVTDASLKILQDPLVRRPLARVREVLRKQTAHLFAGYHLKHILIGLALSSRRNKEKSKTCTSSQYSMSGFVCLVFGIRVSRARPRAFCMSTVQHRQISERYRLFLSFFGVEDPT